MVRARNSPNTTTHHFISLRQEGVENEASVRGSGRRKERGKGEKEPGMPQRRSRRRLEKEDAVSGVSGSESEEAVRFGLYEINGRKGKGSGEI